MSHVAKVCRCVVNETLEMLFVIMCLSLLFYTENSNLCLRIWVCTCVYVNEGCIFTDFPALLKQAGYN